MKHEVFLCDYSSAEFQIPMGLSVVERQRDASIHHMSGHS